MESVKIEAQHMAYIERGLTGMDKQRKLFTVCAVTVLLMITLISCDKKQLTTSEAPTLVPEETIQPTVNASETEPPAKEIPGDVTTNSVKPDTPVIEIIKQSAQPTPTIKPEVASKDTYNLTKPTLMGLKLEANKSTVLTKFGDPTSEHKLEDDGGVINVMEYDDFSVGFNSEAKIEFVEIQSNQIDPGLGGIKVGSKTSDVFTALGKPTSNSSYVITYESSGAILKLDVDIDKDQILSIKLFPDK